MYPKLLHWMPFLPQASLFMCLETGSEYADWQHTMRLGRLPKQEVYWESNATKEKPERLRENWTDTIRRYLKRTGITREEAQQLAVDREERWCIVAHSVFDTGWTHISKVNVDLYSALRVTHLVVPRHRRSTLARPSGVLRRRSDGLECAAWRPPRPVATDNFRKTLKTHLFRNSLRHLVH